MKKTAILATLALSVLFLISSVSAYSYYDNSQFSETWKYNEDIAGKDRGFVLTHTINTPNPYTPLNYGYDGIGYGDLYRYHGNDNIALPTTFTSPAVADSFATFRTDTQRRDIAKWSRLSSYSNSRYSFSSSTPYFYHNSPRNSYW